jgi:hypothetical protein
MKEHAKKALKHDFEVAGKTIPTLAVALLFLVGTGSAALLSTFGAVSGDTTVDQAVTLNSNNVESQSASWAISDVTAGDSVSGEAQTLNNNLDEAVTVDLDGTVPTPSVDDDINVQDSGTAYSGEYLVLENGETFSHVEPNTNGNMDADQDGGSTSYVYTGSDTGVEASYTSNLGHVHSGVWFNVTPTPADQAVIEPDLESNDGNNDWIYAIVTYDGTPYLAGVFSGDPTEYDPDVNHDYSYELEYDDGTQVEDISQIDSRTDFNKTAGTSALSDAFGEETSIDWSEVTVHYAVAGTGTQDGNGATDSLTYTDFHFDDGTGKESLITSVSADGSATDYSVASGDHELGFAANFDVAAYPGAYDFNLEVKP